MAQSRSSSLDESSSRDQNGLKAVPGLDAAVYSFGPFRLDVAAAELACRGRQLPLTPKAFATLRLLVERRGEVVGRDELLRAVWPEAYVEEAVLTQNIYTIRKLLAAAEPGLSYIETVPRRGYRWLAPVEDSRPAPRGRRRLAVLPLQPLVADDEGLALGLGLADALIGRLSGLESVAVRPTSAIRAYTDRHRDPAELAERLAVDAVVDGTLQRANGRIRVSLQLVERGRRSPAWAERFDADDGDLFAVQDTMAEGMARALRLELGAQPRRPSSEVAPEAHLAYLTGRYFWNRRSGDWLAKAQSAFEAAIEREPGYAAAFAGLADVYVLLPLYGNMPPHDAMPRAIAAATRALELDGDLAEAHTSLAYARFIYEWRHELAEASFRRALELDSNYPTAHHWTSYLLIALGRHEEAIERISQALLLDPLSLIINADKGLVLYFAGRHEEAEEQFVRTVELDPEFAYARFGRSMVLEALGDFEGAVDEARAAATLSGDSSAMLGALGRVLGLAGDELGARRVLARLERRAEREYVQAAYRAMVLSGLGDPAAALDAWEQAADERSRFVCYLGVWPAFQRLAGEARFGELVRRVRGV